MPELTQWMSHGFHKAGGRSPAELIESFYELEDQETGKTEEATGQAEVVAVCEGYTVIAVGWDRYQVYGPNENDECLVLKEMG